MNTKRSIKSAWVGKLNEKQFMMSAAILVVLFIDLFHFQENVFNSGQGSEDF
jgi:hypothetical protein